MSAFEGAITALVTPMRDGGVDAKGLAELVEFQIAEGVQGLVPCGSTGEAATLSIEERALVIRTTVQAARRRVPVIAGAGAQATPAAIESSRMAAEAGADALLHVTPFYNRPTQAGLVAHFGAIAAAARLPVILYNVPSRTGCDLLAETALQLARIPGIVGIKEATGSIARAHEILAGAPAGFSLLSGDDPTCLATTLIGGAGVISVASIVAPRDVARMIAAAREGRLEEARALDRRLRPLYELLSLETNPIPAKAAASLLGFGANEVRLPLLPLSGPKLERLEQGMGRLGLSR
jgi:4-hydroxy-tetrahydrodipicolinate synthase